ncbi:MAG: hypothetical protein NUV51_09615 [Sulfuricaulis sp.]|nr:hypothetical protein [Sulfuricaulis sp.]
MKLPALLDEITKTVEIDDSSANEHVLLAQKVSDLADMVGWADGPIDPQRQFAERFETLMELLRLRHAQTSEPSVAALHDVLAELHGAIDRHDRDLAVKRDADEDDEF